MRKILNIFLLNINGKNLIIFIFGKLKGYGGQILKEKSDYYNKDFHELLDIY